MNDFDEKELRKKIRSDLQKKHDQKAAIEKEDLKKLKNIKTELTPALKNYIKQLEEERLFSQQQQFLKCDNHLHEIKWFTALELAEQHEYYPVEESARYNFFKKIFKEKKYKLLDNDEIINYRKDIISEIEDDIKTRLQNYEKLIKDHEPNKKQNRIDDIIDQEEELFYSSHPDYKLYRNYIGKTKWLTEEEFENEEEYTERVRTKKEKIVLGFIWGIASVMAFTAVYFFNSLYWNSSSNGYVVINVNEQQGQLYVNEKLHLGFTNEQAIPLNGGNHKITYRKAGFLTTPSFYEFDISLEDTVKLSFLLTSQKDKSKGLVTVKSIYDDAKIFVNDEFFGTTGNNRQIYLQPGSYAIELKKENFIVSPSSSSIDLLEGDTVNLAFGFTARSNGKRISKSNIKSVLLEINSNVEGASIFINGKDTGEKTNYIFNNFSFGKYIVSLAMDGYKVYPREKIVQLSEKDNLVKTNFKLTRSTMPVTIITRPVEGTINIDGKDAGIGRWTGSLPIGTHKIRFGKISFFENPEETEFFVEDGGNDKFIFTYKSNFSIIFSPEGIKPDNINATIQLGYVENNNEFISDPRNGPKIRRTEFIAGNVWWMGNAFNYRTPPANEAVAISFSLPQKDEFGYDFLMKVWGYRSEQRYPLEIAGTSNIRIKVNGTVIQSSYTPDFALTEANESAFDKFQLGNLLRPGKNIIIISTAKTNKTFYALRKIAIQ